MTIHVDDMLDNCSRYIAISEWIINGTCMCNGHANRCEMTDGESSFPNKVSDEHIYDMS